MSKRFFINNLDTGFGRALLAELVKQPTEQPVHLCTVRGQMEQKPNGIKKILKRQKPKLFRKRVVEECDVYVYSLEKTQLADIQFGIQTMAKPFEDNKVFILVSDIMVWSNSGRKVKKAAPTKVQGEGDPEQQPPAEPVEAPVPSKNDQSQEEEPKDKQQDDGDDIPIEYTFFEDIDYLDRKPLPEFAYIKEIEDKVLQIKRDNIRVMIVCPGIIYGCGEDTFYSHFKAAWLQDPAELPYLKDGSNLIPTIYLKDLAKMVIKAAEGPPEGLNYLLAFDQTEDRSQKAIVQAISKGVGSGKVKSVERSPLIDSSQRFLLNLNIQPSKFYVGTAEQPVEFEWNARKGLVENVQIALKDFCESEKLRPLKLLVWMDDPAWRTASQLDFILTKFSNYYKVPVLELKKILTEAKTVGDQALIEDLAEDWTQILEYVQGTTKTLSQQPQKVLLRAVKWRLAQNDCLNRGYILLNYPEDQKHIKTIFMRVAAKLLKRKKKPKIVPPAPSGQISSKSITDQGAQPAAAQIPPAQQPEAQDEPEAEEGEGGPKEQRSYPESLLTLKQVGTATTVQPFEFFTRRGIEELIYDTTKMKEQEIFDSIRSYFERVRTKRGEWCEMEKCQDSLNKL